MCFFRWNQKRWLGKSTWWFQMGWDGLKIIWNRPKLLEKPSEGQPSTACIEIFSPNFEETSEGRVALVGKFVSISIRCNKLVAIWIWQKDPLWLAQLKDMKLYIQIAKVKIQNTKKNWKNTKSTTSPVAQMSKKDNLFL